ncbi:MAG: hypothetical protein K8R54_08745 [Bacteroidales bacterium]|nr:hypothetical protein [Bacteroidales bacterium]
MNQYTDKDYRLICDYISEKKLSDAFLLTEKHINKINKPEISRSFEKQKETYHYLLEYTFKGINDPEKPQIYKNIQKSLLEISENLKDLSYLKDSTSKLASEKRMLDAEIGKQKITIKEEIENLLTSSKDSESNSRKKNIYKLFFLLWLTDKFSESDNNILKKYARSKKLHFHEKSVLVSAITLSLLRRFDKRKFHVLFNFYDADEENVWNRALVGIVMAFYRYDKRIYLYDDIIARLRLISEDDNIKLHIENIILQFIRSKETEKISKKLRDEIIPEMEKFRPKIQDKLNLDEIISDSLGEDKNPDWEEIFDDAPDLLNKMADFSKLQLEGSDVFMSAFAGFKNFPFFRETANWFMPFYSENNEVNNSFAELKDDFDTEAFTKGLERSVFICNSDKYSFCMNVRMMPEAQRGMILELFKAEMEQMKEISDEDEILNKNKNDKHIFTRYLQDFYRFYKLHPMHNDIEDFFAGDLDIHNTKLFEILIKNKSVSEKIAELYFKKGFFEEAVGILSKIKFKGKKVQKNYEKLGFAFQKLNDYEKALDNYKKAELYSDPSLWLIKKIAFCYRKMYDFENALKYYQRAELEQEDNIYIQANIGHCYLSMGDYENALKKYFKVEYYEPDNVKAMRPIAWCSFVSGNFETSEKYYKKLLDHKPTAYDFINFGHVLFCKGEKMKAMNMYMKATDIAGLKPVEESILEDKNHLLKHGSENTDIDLLIDYIKSKII